MKTGEWDMVVLMAAFFAVVILLGSGIRCEARVDSRPVDAGSAVAPECRRLTGRWECWAKDGEHWHRVATVPDMDSCIQFGNGLHVAGWGCSPESERVECGP